MRTRDILFFLKYLRNTDITKMSYYVDFFTCIMYK